MPEMGKSKTLLERSKKIEFKSSTCDSYFIFNFIEENILIIYSKREDVASICFNPINYSIGGMSHSCSLELLIVKNLK